MRESGKLVLSACGFVVALINGRHMTEQHFGWALGIIIGWRWCMLEIVRGQRQRLRRLIMFGLACAVVALSRVRRPMPWPAVASLRAILLASHFLELNRRDLGTRLLGPGPPVILGCSGHVSRDKSVCC